METKFFHYLPEYNAFGIADEEVKDLCCLELAPECYERLGVKVPGKTAPIIAFLAGQEEGHYTMDFPYAGALRNARVRFLDYEHYEEQLKGCHGLVLPGGAFASPKQYYVDSVDKSQLPEPGARSHAYVESYHTALFMGIPVLGICAGAQIIAGECGGLLYPADANPNATLAHKTKEMRAHEVIIVPGTLLHRLVGSLKLITNSRHRETVAVLPAITGFSLYAVASDGVPEAWGSEVDKVLCVQWHPEDYALAGNVAHARIYEWLTDEARSFMLQK